MTNTTRYRSYRSWENCKKENSFSLAIDVSEGGFREADGQILSGDKKKQSVNYSTGETTNKCMTGKQGRHRTSECCIKHEYSKNYK